MYDVSSFLLPAKIKSFLYYTTIYAKHTPFC